VVNKLFLCALLAGCDAYPDLTFTVADLHDDSLPADTEVQLSNVYVDEIDTFGGTTGDFWAHDADGTGVRVYGSGLAMTPGVYNLSGVVKKDFAMPTDTSGRTDLELQPASDGSVVASPSDTITGTGRPYSDVAVDQVAMAALTADEREARWHGLVGTRVVLHNVRVQTPLKTIGGDASWHSFQITGGATIQSALTAFPTGIVVGTCLSEVHGVVDYIFDYNIYPSDGDMVVGGTGCN
jgi:hypothetical protein